MMKKISHIIGVVNTGLLVLFCGGLVLLGSSSLIFVIRQEDDKVSEWLLGLLFILFCVMLIQAGYSAYKRDSRFPYTWFRKKAERRSMIVYNWGSDLLRLKKKRGFKMLQMYSFLRLLKQVSFEGLVIGWLGLLSAVFYQQASSSKKASVILINIQYMSLFLLLLLVMVFLFLNYSFSSSKLRLKSLRFFLYIGLFPKLFRTVNGEQLVTMVCLFGVLFYLFLLGSVLLEKRMLQHIHVTVQPAGSWNQLYDSSITFDEGWEETVILQKVCLTIENRERPGVSNEYATPALVCNQYSYRLSIRYSLISLTGEFTTYRKVAASEPIANHLSDSEENLRGAKNDFD